MYVNLSTYSDKKSCHTSTTLQTSIAYVRFSRRKIPRTSAYMVAEKAVRFRYPDYNPDRAQKLISSSMSRHLSTSNISSKSVYALLSNLAGNAFNSSFVGGNKPVLYSCITTADILKCCMYMCGFQQSGSTTKSEESKSTRTESRYVTYPVCIL